jgi:MoxR-like ATPase
VALHRAAQAAAWLAGRTFVLPDDVRDEFIPVVAHRVVLDVDRVLRGEQAEQALEAILAQVAAPPVASS